MKIEDDFDALLSFYFQERCRQWNYMPPFIEKKDIEKFIKYCVKDEDKKEVLDILKQSDNNFIQFFDNYAQLFRKKYYEESLFRVVLLTNCC